MGDVSIIPAGSSREVLSAVVLELHRSKSLQPLWGGVKDLRRYAFGCVGLRVG